MIKKDSSQGIDFIKMHGLGNDFVIIDNRLKKHNLSQTMIKKISDRHFGVGFDQLIFIEKSKLYKKEAVASMIIYNQDGSVSEMCGNAARCVARVLFDEQKEQKAQQSLSEIKIECGKKLLLAQKISELEYKIDMGKPLLGIQSITGDSQDVIYSKDKFLEITKAWNIFAENNNLALLTSEPILVNIGNPHIVFFLKNKIDNLIAQVRFKELVFDSRELVKNLAEFCCLHSIDNINANFAYIENKSKIHLRVFERGVGETFACGSGACATATAAFSENLVDENVLVKLQGGDLNIEMQTNISTEQIFYDNPSDNHITNIYMSGKAEYVFLGIL